jgi:hypothetical protein
MNEVRSVATTPAAAAFTGRNGTPIIIDRTGLKAYALSSSGVVFEIGTAAAIALIDDTPQNGETARAVSSNWAFDHAAAADPHPGYLTPAEGNAAYQPLDSDLTTLAASITAFGHSLVDDADATTARTTLALGTAAVKNTGASGDAVPLLNVANTWAEAQTNSKPPVVPNYTVVGVPSAAPAGQLAYISNETGGAVLAFSDGTDWRRVTDRAVIS